jgi:hypothetical protein
MSAKRLVATAKCCLACARKLCLDINFLLERKLLSKVAGGGVTQGEAAVKEGSKEIHTLGASVKRRSRIFNIISMDGTANVTRRLRTLHNVPKPLQYFA